MENINYKAWATFNEEFASKLLTFKDNRAYLIASIKQIYEETGIKLPTLEKDNIIVDIDPFTVFGLFNKDIKLENRIAIITQITKKFDLKSQIPQEFDGLPVLNPLASTFYRFANERKEDDIKKLWNIFEKAIQYADTQNLNNKNDFIYAFDNVANQKGIKWNITMGLFWIRPYFYLNLDGLSRSFLSNAENKLSSITDISPQVLKGEVPSGTNYLAMCDECKKLFSLPEYRFTNFPEMSHLAWVTKAKPADNNKTVKISKASILKWFTPLIQALKDLGGSATPAEAIAKIVDNENIGDEILNETRGKTNQKKFDNEIRWTRQSLCDAGIISKSKRGIWKLTEQGKDVVITDELASQIFRKKWSVENENSGINSIHKKRYWVYAAGENARKWEEYYNDGIMGVGWDDLGDFEKYSSREDIRLEMQSKYGADKSYKNHSLTAWQFTNDVQIGDIVYSKKGLNGILGRGIVESDYIYDESREEYKHIRKVKWTHRGEFAALHQLAQKTLTDITQYTKDVVELEALFLDDEEISIEERITTPYTKEDFLKDIYMSEEKYETLTTLLDRKKNIILQGAPGVGKTYVAKRLAYSIMGENDTNRVEMIQFHQSYAYEDFIMGYRPDNDGFKLVHGVFYKFCKKAQDDDKERAYFFIIDEINRGNLSKIFGELFMLIEHDKRDDGHEIQLLYDNELFSIPSNVHIIGMMNTADRSLAMLDYALRRRFAFFEMEPAFDSDGFTKYQSSIANTKFNKLIDVIKQLNNAIREDVSLGAGFRIGHSYFMADEGVIDETWLNTVVNYEIVPLLQEYWFDEMSKVDEWTNKLRAAIV